VSFFKYKDVTRSFVQEIRNAADSDSRVLQVKPQHGQQMTVSRAGARTRL